MRDTITILDDFNPILREQANAPLVTLYLPLDGTTPNETDRIQLKNLVTEAGGALEREFPHRESRDVLKNLDDLSDNLREIAGPAGAAGLAVFADAEKVRVVRLMCGLDPRVVVGEHFYTKPLLRSCQYGAHFILLGLSSDRFSLVHVDFGLFRHMEAPQSNQDEFGSLFEMEEGGETTLDYPTSDETAALYRGYKSRNDVKKEETEKFFRHLNKIVTDWLVSEGNNLPVVLVSLPEHQALFRTFATVPHLLTSGIEQPFESLSAHELLEEASLLVERERLQRIDELLEDFGTARAHGRASTDAAEVGKALFNRRVGALFLETGRSIPGTFDEETGAVSFSNREVVGEQADPTNPDLSGAFVRAALYQAADIFIIDANTMPTDSGIAALFRY